MSQAEQSETGTQPETAELLTLDQVVEPEAAEPKGEPETAPEPEKTPEPEKDSTPEPGKKDEPWHLKAVMDEREKRQAAQREAEELRKQLESLKEKPKPTSIFDDEGKFRQEILEEFESVRLNDRLNTSQALMEDKYGVDVVASKVTKFKELAASNPDLRQRFASAALPYRELITIVDQHEKAREMEDIDGYKAKIEAEVREKVLKELEAQQAAEAQKRAAITPSLASRRSQGGLNQDTHLIGLEDVVPE